MTLRPPVRLFDKYASVLVTAPASEPVTAAELRSQLIVDSTQLPDAEANALITDARTEIENRLNLAIITQTWKMAIDRWPTYGEMWWDGVRQMAISELYASGNNGSIALPRYPLQSITSVTTYNESSQATVINVSETFDIDAYSNPGRITLKRGATWPTALRANNAIEIVYVSGYGNAAAVPLPIKRAIKQMAAYLYAHRGDGCDPSEAFEDSGASSALSSYRVMKV